MSNLFDFKEEKTFEKNVGHVRYRKDKTSCKLWQNYAEHWERSKRAQLLILEVEII